MTVALSKPAGPPPPPSASSAGDEQRRQRAMKLRSYEGASADGLGPDWCVWRRRRYLLALLAFFGFAVSMVMRVNLGVAIVAMTANHSVARPDGTIAYEREFDWDTKVQGLLLSAFFYGYILTTLPGGWLAARLGGKRVFGVGMLGTVAFTLLVPPLAHRGADVIVALRVLIGLFEGVTWPSMHALWARWAPPLERARLANFALTGLSMGPVVGMSACGVLADYAGWQSTFYVTGAAGALWLVAWWALVTDSPEDDPRITPKEKKFILEALGSAQQQEAAVPYGRILTSLPVWSVAVAHFCEGWGYTTFLTQLPSFIRDTLKFDLSQAGFLSALPYTAMIVSLPSVSILADWLVSRSILSITQARKAFNCSAFLAQTIFLMVATIAKTPAGVVAAMTIAQGIGAFACCGFSVNPLDLAPQYASFIMGLSCTVATLSGMISPVLTGFVVQNQTEEEWNVVFYVTSAIYLFGAVFYGLFASGERQPWAETSSVPDAADGDGAREALALRPPPFETLVLQQRPPFETVALQQRPPFEPSAA